VSEWVSYEALLTEGPPQREADLALRPPTSGVRPVARRSASTYMPSTPLPPVGRRHCWIFPMGNTR
jgi:hypothetical protein